MRTLLTERQVSNLEKSNDKISARCVVKIGDTRKVGKFFKKKFVLVEKLIFKINKCPHCGSTNSFHKRQQDVYGIDKDRHYGNVYKVYSEKDDENRISHKIDYCLDCHKEFSIEMFIWKRVRR